MKFYIVCSACGAEFHSYEEYVNHVFEKHEDHLSLRMTANIRKDSDEHR